MNEPAAIILCSLVFFATWLHLCREDIFFAGAYLWIFIYTIFTQYGYWYLPDLSMALRLYFGIEVFMEYSIFVTASLAVIYCFSLVALRQFCRGPLYAVRKIDIPGGRFPYYCITFCHLGLLSFLFAKNYGRLEYSNSSDEFFLSAMGFEFLLFGVLFKLQVITNAVLYAVLRGQSGEERLRSTPLWVLLAVSVVLFAAIAIKVGSRTDPLALLLAVAAIELQIGVLSRTLMRRFVLIGILIFFGLSALTYIANRRSEDQSNDWRASVIANDYYIPSHMLIAAIAFNYVDPMEVVRSNAGNALIKMNQPYLQAAVTDHFSPGLTTRSASYAFYVLTEGYLFAGRYGGVLYNGIVLVFWLSVWRSLASSHSLLFNLAVLGMISSQFANIARGQTSYFFKDLYLLFLPGFVSLILLTGLMPSRMNAKAERRQR
jgi:hypothetical protein